MNLQVIASPGGDVLWVSGALPGSVHDKKAEWIGDVLAEMEAARVTLADKGYQRSSYAKIPYRGKNKPESQKQANRAHAKLRAPGERANAQLKARRILRKLRCCPRRAGQLAKAIHALQIREAYRRVPGGGQGRDGRDDGAHHRCAPRVQETAWPCLSGSSARTTSSSLTVRAGNSALKCARLARAWSAPRWHCEIVGQVSEVRHAGT